MADERTLDVQLSAELPKVSSVHFVCSNGKTVPGEAIYVLGNIAELGAWDPAKAVRLTPVRYPKWFRWSTTVHDLPPATELEWKFIKRKESGGPPLAWDVEGPNHRVTTASSGFTGTACEIRGLLTRELSWVNEIESYNATRFVRPPRACLVGE